MIHALHVHAVHHPHAAAGPELGQQLHRRREGKVVQKEHDLLLVTRKFFRAAHNQRGRKKVLLL